ATVTMPPPAVPSTVFFASSSCAEASRSWSACACFKSPPRSKLLMMCSSFSCAPVADAAHLGTREDVHRRLHHRIGERLLGPSLRLRRRRVVRVLRRERADLDRERTFGDLAHDPPQRIEGFLAGEIAPQGFVLDPDLQRAPIDAERSRRGE